MVLSDFTKQEYSTQDFLKLIERRIRKEIRQNDLISIKKSYFLSEKKSLQSNVLTYFLKQIFEERINLEGTISISTDYLELFIEKRLSVFLEAKPPQELFDKTITPLRSITEHEIKEVAKILNIAGEFIPVHNEIIFDLQEKYSQSKPSFLKSFSNIQELKKEDE